jgi:hypothetical protein
MTEVWNSGVWAVEYLVKEKDGTKKSPGRRTDGAAKGGNPNGSPLFRYKAIKKERVGGQRKM